MRVRRPVARHVVLLGGLLLGTSGSALAQGGFRVTTFRAAYEIRGDGSLEAPARGS